MYWIISSCKKMAKSQNNMKQVLPVVSFAIVLSISAPFVKWTSVHCARDRPLPSSNPLAPWQDYKQPPEMQASVLGKDISVSHLDPLHPALNASVSSLCSVFPGCRKADYTLHPHTKPILPLLFLFLPFLLLSAYLSWKNKPFLSSCWLASVCAT